MARIGDTVRPELGRADTSGILRGTMQGASALGQGIAALGAGVGAGIKQRKQHEKDVTSTISRLESLKKSVPEKSPLSTMLDAGINTLSNPDLSPRNAAAMAAGFNQSIDDHWTKTEMGLKEATVAMQQKREDATLPGIADQSGILAAGSEAISKAHADFTDTAGDPEAFEARVADRIQGISDPEGWQQEQRSKRELIEEFQSPQGMLMDPARIDKAMEFQREPVPTIPIGEMVPEVLGTDMGDPGAAGVLPPRQGSTKEQRIAAYLQEVNKLQAQTGGGAITFDEFEDLDPQTGKVVVRQFMKQGGRIVKELPTVPKGSPFATPEQQAQATALVKRYGSAEDRTQFAIKTGHESKEALVKVDSAIELLNDDDVYTGAFSGVRERFLAMVAPFGFSETWSRKLAKAETLGVFLGDFVMARVAQTKGAISEKEMDLFAKWAAGGSKSKEGNLRILQALRGVETRRIALSREANRLIREDKNRNAVELDFMLQDWMDNKMPVFEESEYRTLVPDEPAAPRRPGQRPGRSDTSVPSSARERSQGLGARLRQYNAPAPQAPAPQAPAPQAATPQAAVEPPLPQGRPPAAALPQGATEQNTLPARRHHTQGFIRSPHVENALALIDLHKVAEQMGYENWYNIPSGTVIPDRHAPGKFVRIP